MKRRALAVIVFLLFMVVGIYERESHGDVWKEYQQTGDCGEYKVNYVFAKEIQEMLDYERDYYSGADVIAEAKMVKETSKQIRDSMEYVLEIEKVWNGDCELEGRQVRYEVIMQCYSGQYKEIYNKFVNFMKPEKRYLVFLYKPNVSYDKNRVYTSHNFSQFPYFVIGETDNAFDEEEYEKLEQSNYYKTMEDNEFFVKNQEGLNILMKFKQEIMDTYRVEK